MIEPRNVLIVALYILNMIPDDKKDFHNELDYLIKQDFVYKCQEELTTPYSWGKMQGIMYKHIPLVDEEWKQNIIDVYIGKTSV